MIKLLLIFVLFCAGPAFAGFQSMRPPPGWNPGNPPAYKPAPGEFYDLDKRAWMTLSKVDVGGKLVTVPTRLPLLPALDVGLAVASAFSANPAIMVATAAFALYNYYLSQKDITANSDGTFTKLQDTSSPSCVGNYEYRFVSGGYTGAWACTITQAATSWASVVTSGGVYSETLNSCTGSNCYFSYTRNSTGFTGTETVSNPQSRAATTTTGKIPVPYTPQQVATDMAPVPLPSDLAKSLPYAIPVTSPVINPGADGLPQTQRVPQGLPQPLPLPSPNPDNEPQKYRQPVIDIVPSPTVDDPWRVDTQPKDIISTDPTPITTPTPVSTTPDPNVTTEATPDLSASDTPLEDIPKLYEPKYPDGIVGVWNQKKADLKSTPLISLVSTVMPNLGDGGTCPTWTIDLDLGIANYGSHNVAPPCWIFAVLKSIVIVSALLLARALVFGG